MPPYLDQVPSEFPFATNRRELVAAAGFGPGAAAPSTLLEPLENLLEHAVARDRRVAQLFYFLLLGATESERSYGRSTLR